MASVSCRRLLVVLAVVAAAAASASSAAGQYLGINYGGLGDNLPPPHRGMELARSAGASSVRFYDSNATLLAAAASSGMDFIPSVPNELIPSLASSQRAADDWVASTLVPYRGNPRLRYLLIGNEFLSNPNVRANWSRIVPAMANAERALRRHGLGHVRVSTTLSINDIGSRVSPPSAGAFRPEIAEPIMRPMLGFLGRTDSCLFLDAYTYFTWSENHTVFPLTYALLEEEEEPSSPGPFVVHDPGTGLSYSNLLDQMIDATVAAMCRVGGCGVRLALAETGWPTAGDIDQFGANLRNAAIYNRNLARKLAAGGGTPRRPGVPLEAMVFALFNEDLKWGPETERHWGLFYPNGTAVYELDLTGRRPLASYPPLPPAPAGNDRPYRGPLWCVVRTDTGGGLINETAVREQVATVCEDEEEAGLCDPVRPGGACFLPNTLTAHASYVFSAHWHKKSLDYGACYFDGWGMETTIDPSHGSCKFPSIHIKGA